MARAERRALIEKLQKLRSDRLCITYVTSTRPNFEVSMADNVVRLVFDHLEANKAAAEKGVDLFIHSNGGQGTVPWRIASLVREYTKDFCVLVPHHAFSAATLMAMGANKIVMHRMGVLGPIDPSVANQFNPAHPSLPGQLLPISVEDVTAYFKLVRDEIGIQHEDELIQALTALTDKVHPLALGNVQRSHQQARMMARKLLKLHMQETDPHKIDQMIDNLKSNLFYHGHPINRREAREDLKLEVEDAPQELADVMWKLYEEYETAMKLTEQFQPVHEWLSKQPPPGAPGPVTTQQIVQQMHQLAQNGVALPGVTPAQLVELAVAMLPHVTAGAPPASKKLKLEKMIGACVESIAHANLFLTDIDLERVVVNTPTGPHEGMKQEFTWQRWEREA